MEDFDIELMETNQNDKNEIQLPVNFLTIGEIENDDVKVYIKQDVYKALEEYAVSDTEHELGTIILGNHTEELGKMHVIISDYILAKYTDASASTLTFTHETWDYVHREHDEKYPDKKIVGWQHTHPGYGIFLSNYDMFIQENFFNIPFQVAYVIDPVQHLRGFFQWKNGKVEKLKGFYIYDDLGKNIKISQPQNKKKKEEELDNKKNKTNILLKATLCVLSMLFLCVAIADIFLIVKFTHQLEAQDSLINDLEGVKEKISEQEIEIASVKKSLEQANGDELEKGDSENEKQELTEDIAKEENTTDATENNDVMVAREVKFISYSVMEGDSLTAICDKYGLDYSSTYKIILAVNGLENADEIYPDQMILLPIEPD